MGLPRAQAQGSVEQHRCVHTGLRRWHLIPPVPELMAQAAAMGGFGLITITSAPLEKIQLGLPWPVLEHSCSQPHDTTEVQPVPVVMLFHISNLGNSSESASCGIQHTFCT